MIAVPCDWLLMPVSVGVSAIGGVEVVGEQHRKRNADDGGVPGWLQT